MASCFGCPGRSPVETGLLLGPGGEFAFVGIGMAAAAGLIEPTHRELRAGGHRGHHGADAAAFLRRPAFRGAAARRRRGDPANWRRGRAAANSTRSSSATAASAKSCARCCKQHGIPYIAADMDASTVTRDRREGHDVFYGDAADPTSSKPAASPRRPASSSPSTPSELIDEVVEHVRAMRPDILIVARARDADHARHLYGLGATDAVPETVEASLQLSEAALVGFGIADRAAYRLDPREARRNPPRLAAGGREAGLEKIHSLRRKRHEIPDGPATN